ncbi:MAG: STAS domain-containing protein [Candidatus Fibromonas sp.]|jgi:anti-anti-sigma factor|nr:STAS domain-containing protein [Candidatus Fibromonas sp.]
MAECVIEDKGGYYQIIDFDFEAENFHDIFPKIENALKVKKQDILMSLASIGVLYSSHLAILVRMHQMMHKNNLHFVISDISPEIRNLLQITQLDSIFFIYETVNDFIKTLKSISGKHQAVLSFEWQITKTEGDTATVVCKGNMFAGEQLDELRKNILDFFCINFDFSDLQSMDSESLAFLDTVAGNHTVSIAGASPEFVEQLRQKLIYGKVKLL